MKKTREEEQHWAQAQHLGQFRDGLEVLEYETLFQQDFDSVNPRELTADVSAARWRN